MGATFAEAVRAIEESCTWMVAVVPLAVVLAGRAKKWLVATVVVAVIAFGWLRFVGVDSVGVPFGNSSLMTQILMQALLIAVVAVTASHQRWVAAIAATVAVYMAIAWWRPCVGLQLAAILNDGPDHPLRQFLPTVSYMTGLLTPTFAAFAAFELLRRPVTAAADASEREASDKVPG